MSMDDYQRLETEFGEWIGIKNVVCCSSGTAALHLALEAFHLPPGSEVVLPDYTMIACARAVTLAGLTPVFADCGPDGLINPRLLDRAVGPKTRVIMAVHVYGRRCDMDAVATVAGVHDLYVIEDMAEAHGIPVHPGTDAACYSFYQNKIIFGEEGGAVAVRGGADADRLRSLRTLGFTASHDYTHVPRGHNYRLANALASLILTSLRDIGRWTKLRRLQVAAYDGACPDEWRRPPRAANWVYDFRVPGMTGSEQRRAVEALRASGIMARYGFKPCSTQEEYAGCRAVTHAGARGESMAAELGRQIVYVPLGQTAGDVTVEGVARVFDTVRRVLGR